MAIYEQTGLPMELALEFLRSGMPQGSAIHLEILQNSHFVAFLKQYGAAGF